MGASEPQSEDRQPRTARLERRAQKGEDRVVVHVRREFASSMLSWHRRRRRYLNGAHGHGLDHYQTWFRRSQRQQGAHHRRRQSRPLQRSGHENSPKLSKESSVAQTIQEFEQKDRSKAAQKPFSSLHPYRRSSETRSCKTAARPRAQPPTQPVGTAWGEAHQSPQPRRPRVPHPRSRTQSTPPAGCGAPPTHARARGSWLPSRSRRGAASGGP
eukprot:Amastigsp_a847203_9.p1 type:complete len:214 gc:universal Amastigsp_a847203_9:323-964(+)